MSEETHLIEIKDNRIQTTTSYGNITKYGALWMNFMQLLLVLYSFLIFYQGLPTVVTYFSPTDMDCNLNYDLGIHRWIFFAYALFLIPDVVVSFMIGQKVWGKITLAFNVISLGGLCITFVVIIISYIPNCNKSGANIILNICNDPRACGTALFLSNVINKCQISNPSLKPIFPIVEISDLRWSSNFKIIFWFIFTHILFGLAKTIMNGTQPATIKMIRNNIQKGLQLIKDAKEGNLSAAAAREFNDKSGVKKKGSKYIVGYTSAGFFLPFTNIQVKIYMFGVITYFFYMLWYLSFTGWILQHTRSVSSIYTHELESNFSAMLFNQVNWEHFIFYFILGLNIFPLILNLFTGHIFENWIGIVGGLFGIIINSIIIIWGLLWYGATCYLNGYPNNICHNARNMCQDPQSYPQNGCKNVLGCSRLEPIASGIAGFDTHYILIMMFNLWALMHNLFVFVYAVSLYRQFKNFRGVKKDK